MNLLKNPNFALPGPRGGFQDWNNINFRISKKDSNPSPEKFAAEFDEDKKRDTLPGWFYGQEGTLSQVVHAPDEHGVVNFSITEIHHLSLSTVYITLEGSADGVAWEEIWRRDGLPMETYAKTAWDWYTSIYTIISTHAYCKLTFYGLYLHPEGKDGWKFTLLELTTI